MSFRKLKMISVQNNIRAKTVGQRVSCLLLCLLVALQARAQEVTPRSPFDRDAASQSFFSDEIPTRTRAAKAPSNSKASDSKGAAAREVLAKKEQALDAASSDFKRVTEIVRANPPGSMSASGSAQGVQNFAAPVSAPSDGPTDQANGSEEEAPVSAAPSGPVFVSSDPSSHMAPPDEDVKVRINAEAPGPFVAMASAYQQGDIDGAKGFARQFVRYMVNVVFQVKQLTNLIGEAMVQEGVIKEEDWVGVEQYMDYEMAIARRETDAAVKATHEEALKLIKSDPKGQVEVYFFFTLNSKYARKMAPDVERLWQVAKGDPRIKMIALTMGPYPKDWIEGYRGYTGLTIPIMNGAKLAKKFRVAFTPTVVVVTPNQPSAYIKTGQQTFQRLYEFVRTAQGEKIEFDAKALKLASLKIGFEEQKAGNKGVVAVDYRQGAEGAGAKGSSAKSDHGVSRF